MDTAKEKLGAIVYLTTDMDRMRAQAEALIGQEGEEATEFTMPSITRELAEQIAKSAYLKEYTYSISASANASSFKVVKTALNEREQALQGTIENFQGQIENFNRARRNFNSSGGGFAPPGEGGVIIGGGHAGGGMRTFNFNFNMQDPNLSRGDTSLIGVNDFNYIEGVESGEISIFPAVTFIIAESRSENNCGTGIRLPFHPESYVKVIGNIVIFAYSILPQLYYWKSCLLVNTFIIIGYGCIT